MSDTLLTIQDRQEKFSRAYAAAIAAGAGYVTYVPDVDRDSVDIGFNAGGDMRPNLQVQLKSTINLRKVGDVFKFQLQKKNYDDLRARTQVPRILVVLDLPRSEKTWLNISVKRLIIRRCAFWMSLNGMPALPEQRQSITLDIPSDNRFDVESLKEIMQMARSGAVS
jgi:hypothetical protein